MTSGKKYRGAVIGLGNIAMRGHLPAFGLLKDSVDIVAVMDVNDHQRQAVSEVLPGAKFTTSLDELLGLYPDFVDICTPPFTHAHYVRTCAERPVHMICEKPLTERNETVREVSQALQGRHVVFMPCHQYKYSPLWKTIHDVVVSGALGRVTFAQFNVIRLQADTGTQGWNPTWRINKNQSGGGILTDTGAHYFYLVQYLFGLPVHVSSVMRTLKHAEYPVEDTAVVMLDYEDKLIQINLTWAASQRANSALVTGTEGSLMYDGVRLVQTRGDVVTELQMPDVSDKNQYIRWYADLFQDFFARIESKNYSPDQLEEAVHVMDMLDRSYKSAKKHAWQDIP